MSNLEIVWAKNGFGVGERCVVNRDGDFIGVETGNKYLKDDYYCSKKISAIVKSIDEKQKNGMIHLDPSEENWKNKLNFIGCQMTFREAHYFGDIRVYHCFETGEYYNQNELEIL